MSSSVHPFQRAGLGLAPFRVVEFSKSVYRAHPDAPIQPGDACDYCGTGIMNVYHIKSDDGRSFVVGCDCVAKTGDAHLVRQVKDAKRHADRGARAARREANRAARASMRKTEAGRKAAAFLSHEGLVAALNADHGITRNIRARFRQWGSLSDAQVSLVFKLARQVEERAAEAAEPKVEAPEGRQIITGKVLSCKWKQNGFGGALKMLVKVTTPEGTWKTWGTVPASLDAGDDALDGLRGVTVTFTATVQRAPDDSNFSFFKRPSKASVVTG